MHQWNAIEDPDRKLHSCGHLISEMRKRYIEDRGQPLQQMLLGKLDIHLWRNETRSLHKNQLTIDPRPVSKTGNSETVSGKSREETRYGYRQGLLEQHSSCSRVKTNIQQMGTHQIKSFVQERKQSGNESVFGIRNHC